MSDPSLIDGDLALYDPNFGAAIVIVMPGKLVGTGPAKVQGKCVCVEGDEASACVLGCLYTTAQHPIPGTGKLSVKQLADDQKAKTTSTGATPLLLKGSKFTAVFEVIVPAQQPAPPAPPIPDATPQYIGTGSFITFNLATKAS